MIIDNTDRSITKDNTAIVIYNIKLSDFGSGKVGAGANVGVRNVKYNVDVRVDKIPII